jgi:hypothetical protein
VPAIFVSEITCLASTCDWWICKVLMGMTVADAILDRDHDSLLQDTRGLISTTLWYTIDTTMLPVRVFRWGKIEDFAYGGLLGVVCVICEPH